MSTSRSAPSLRIAIVSDWYLPRFGGIEMQLSGLAQALLHAGMSVEVFTPVPGLERVEGIVVNRLNPGPGPTGGYLFPPQPVAANLSDLLYVLELLARRGASGPLGRLKQALASGRFDVVHAQLGNTPFSYMAVNACIALSVPVVATFHSMLAPGEIPYAAMGSRLLGCDKWQGKVTVTAVSSRVAEVRQPMLGGQPIDILPNGIDAQFWSQTRLARGTGPGPVELVAAMRLHPRKRPMALLQALKALHARGLPDDSYRLCIAGDGPLRERLMQQAKALELGERVRFVGRLDRPALAGLLCEADLFLMPSHFESFGIAALEARMAGVPVLTMEGSGAWDFLTPHVDSLMAADDAGFVEALAGFLKNAQVRAQLQAGCATPLDGYDWQALVLRAIGFYRKAMTEAGRSE